MSIWYELVIEGSEKLLQAFVLGFIAGRGEAVGGVFGSDLPLESESLGERLRTLFAAGSHHVFLAPEGLALSLVDALTQRGASVGLRLERRRVVQATEFSFRAEVYSRDVATGIRTALLDALPSGVRVERLSEAEEIHPEVHGPEPFAPLHSFVYRISGRMVGPFEGVLTVWERSHNCEFLETDSFRVIAS
jgi:hypothetical protein